MTHLGIVQDTRDDAVLLRVDGDVDSGTVGRFASAIGAAVEAAKARRAPFVVVDLNAVTYFGSAALNALLDGSEQSEAHDVALRIVATNVEVTRPIEVTRLQDILRPHHSLSEALAYPREDRQ